MKEYHCTGLVPCRVLSVYQRFGVHAHMLSREQEIQLTAAQGVEVQAYGQLPFIEKSNYCLHHGSCV